MQYLSTRGHPARPHFCDILLEGLAPDGGLYLPQHYPQIDGAALTRLRSVLREQGYAELAFQILSLYIDDIPAADLKRLCEKTYTAEVFGTGEIVMYRGLVETVAAEHAARRTAMKNATDNAGDLIDALRQLDGGYAFVALTNDKMIGARDPWGLRPLVLGALEDGSPVLCSETCALDAIGGGGWGRLGLGVAGDGGCRQAEAALGVGAFAAGGQQVGGGGQAQCGLQGAFEFGVVLFEKLFLHAFLQAQGGFFVGFGIHAYNAAVQG